MWPFSSFLVRSLRLYICCASYPRRHSRGLRSCGRRCRRLSKLKLEPELGCTTASQCRHCFTARSSFSFSFGPPACTRRRSSLSDPVTKFQSRARQPRPRTHKVSSRSWVRLSHCCCCACASVSSIEFADKERKSRRHRRSRAIVRRPREREREGERPICIPPACCDCREQAGDSLQGPLSPLSRWRARALSLMRSTERLFASPL